jgi:heat shock protein HtpX
VSPSQVPNAFAIQAGHRSAPIVAVTDGLLSCLDERELEAVLAHELAHLLHRDAAVMTYASIPRTAGQLLFIDAVWFTFLIWPFGLLLYCVGSLLTLALSRYREYSADRLAAVATGEPERLMSALQRLSAAIERIPQADLRSVGAVNQLFIVPVERSTVLWGLLADHPPLSKRLEHLSRIARELGKAV